MKNIGNAVVEAVQHAGITPYELSRKMNVHSTYIYQLRTREHVSCTTVKRIGDAIREHYGADKAEVYWQHMEKALKEVT